MTQIADDPEGLYQLSVKKGSATNLLVDFTRTLPLETVVSLRDALQSYDVFNWEESYTDTRMPGSLRWSLSLVFQEGVFSITSKGGSDTPQYFTNVLEEFYKLDFPRSDSSEISEGSTGATGSASALDGKDMLDRGELSNWENKAGALSSDELFQGSPLEGLPTGGEWDRLSTIGSALGSHSFGAYSAGDLSAYAATKGASGDFSFLNRVFSSRGLDGNQNKNFFEETGFDFSSIDKDEVAALFADMKRNPQKVEQNMKDEFKSLSKENQDQLLDALASTGIASRAWWERFFRGL